MREDERDEFYLLDEEGNQHLEGDGGFQEQQHSMDVCLVERKLREIEHRAMSCLVVKT